MPTLVLKVEQKDVLDTFYDKQNELRKQNKGRLVNQSRTFCSIVKEWADLKKKEAGK